MEPPSGTLRWVILLTGFCLTAMAGAGCQSKPVLPDSPVVELSLLCEYVFHRTPAFEAIKPEQIKKELSGEEEEV